MLRRSLLGAIGAGLITVPAARAMPTPSRPILGFKSGELGGTFVRIAEDLHNLVADTLDIDVHLNSGSVENVIDLALQPHIDLATVAVDALPHVVQQKLLPPRLAAGICYIAKLYDNDVHVEAGPEIKGITDLEGKPVNIDVPGAGTNLTLRTIFAAYGIKPQFREDSPTLAQAKLQRGEIAANCYCIGKPGTLFRSVPAGTNLHLVPVPYDLAKLPVYVPSGQFTNDDYPTLVAEDAPVSTVGVGVVLAAFNFAPPSPRYRNLSLFTDLFFSRFPELLKPGHHPKWKDVNLSAAQPGWPRFPEASAWLQRSKERGELVSFARQHGTPLATTQDQDALFKSFEAWRQHQR